MFKYMSETDLSCFCIENTKIILLEIPYGRMNSWVINELESIIYEQKLTVILAHLDR